MITKALSDTRSTNITILTGPIKSGKTTFLMELLENIPDCGGFLTPDIHGRRHFFRLDTKECLPFEIDPTSDKDHTLLILIVRNYLVHEVMERYKLNCTIIDILEKEKIQLKLGI